MSKRRLPSASRLGLLLVALLCEQGWASLDLEYRGWGISLGNARQINGVRINGIDRKVESVNGLNLTLWNPDKSPRAVFNGAALGLIGPKAGRLHGLALGGLGATAQERIWGLAAGGFGVGTTQLRGLAVGGLMVDVKASARGVAASGFTTRIEGDMHGLGLALGGVQAGNFRGLALGGVSALVDTVEGVLVGGLIAGSDKANARITGAVITPGIAIAGKQARGLAVGGLLVTGGRLSGLGLSAGGVHAVEDGRGLFVGGLGVGANKRLTGIALSLGGIGAGDRLRGLALAGFGVGAGKRLEGFAASLGGVGSQGEIRGVALGGLTVLAPDIEGLAAGALNGVIVHEVNLDDFLKVKKVNQRFVGLSIGLVNYTRQLQGVQLGLFNYAGNNPRWLRLLPVINAHF